MNPKHMLSCMPMLLTACTAAQSLPDAHPIPASLAPEAAHLAMVVPAQGFQIYECRAKAGAAGAYEWAFVAPDATLFDAAGKAIGRHGAGPYWEAADGSRVVATVKARADAPVAGTIPWLLLASRSTGPAGSFSGVTSIQRVNTTGGAQPDTPCNASNAGARSNVRYTADYRFFTAQSTR
jgi:hypothetical protein